MVINSKVLSIVIPLVLVLGIGGSMMAGLWNSGDKVPSRYEENELNPYDPQSISGSYSFSSVSEFYEIPVEVLYDAFSISSTFDPSIFKAKNLGSIYEAGEFEIGTEALQAFVALYNDLSYELVDVYLPTSAVNLILQHNLLITDDQKAYLDTHTITVVVLDPSLVTLTEDDETTTEFSVKGPTTIQEVLDAGLTKAEFEAIVGTPVTFTNQTVKDFCIAKGLSFSEIKLALQEAIN
jgi:hypothetical protein